MWEYDLFFQTQRVKASVYWPERLCGKHRMRRRITTQFGLGNVRVGGGGTMEKECVMNTS